MCSASPPNISVNQMKEGEKLEYSLEFHQLLRLNKSQFKIASKFLSQDKLEEMQNWLKENFKGEYASVRSMIEVSIKDMKKRKRKKE